MYPYTGSSCRAISKKVFKNYDYDKFGKIIYYYGRLILIIKIAKLDLKCEYFSLIYWYYDENENRGELFDTQHLFLNKDHIDLIEIDSMIKPVKLLADISDVRIYKEEKEKTDIGVFLKKPITVSKIQDIKIF